MTPYYQDDYVTIYHGDCLKIVPQLDQQFDVVCLDPPYGKVKGDFDHEWSNRPAMLADAAEWRCLAFDAMKANGTLWWFAWPSLAGRLEALIAKRLNPLAHIVWQKPAPLVRKNRAESLRAPVPETERLLMFELYGADNKAHGESGYVTACDKARGFVFEPLRKYLDDERERAGWTCAAIDKAWREMRKNKGGMSSHWFSRSQWQLPKPEHYEWLRNLFNKSENDAYLQKEYAHLQKEYAHLQKEYEELRRYFRLRSDDPKTDVWKFGISGNKSGHPTEKPLDLIAFILRISCRPGGTVLDFFAGSGTTGRAAKDMRRKCVLVEREEKYCEIAANRMLQEVLPLE